jgi:hypothetical protein
MDPKKRKIERVPIACDFCKFKRIKCTGQNPCDNCKKKNMKCIYTESKKRGRKVKNAEKKIFDNFSNACIYLYNGIPFNIPLMNNENSIYDVLNK